MKRLLVLFVFLMCLALYAVPEAEAAPRRITLLLSDQPGGESGSFNDICVEGLERAKRKYKNRIVTRKFDIQNVQEKARDTLLEAARTSDLVIINSYRYMPFLAEAAEAAPDARFIALDGEPGEQKGVTRVLFRDEEGAFLAGALAALVTEQSDLQRINGKRVVGIVLGEKISATERFEKGFRAGVWYINRNVTALCDYTGSFINKELAKSAAAAQSAKGADVIFAAAGRSGQGVIDLAARDKKFWVIGVDSEQEKTYGEDVLTSVVKRMDYLILRLIDVFLEKGFEQKQVTIGLGDGAIDLSLWSRSAKQNISLSIRRQLDEISDKIEKGLIIIK